MPTQLGPYTIDREIGRGGMGVVYLGHDTKLDRPVAIKALPEHLAQDPERLMRFEREARTLAQLTHPNVAGIYGIEEAEGHRYLALEYVDGETLAERLDRGPLTVDDALEVCVLIAAGVEAAHEAGVIHRDLKPGNVKITPDGKVKVLDFGLAKASETTSGSSSFGSHSQSPTATGLTTPHSPTSPGAVLGTAPYMSPEQARGRSVDKRTDIWSFGVVLYECLTGASPFVGETASDSIGAILHKEVDLDRLPAETPAMLRHVLSRCLVRDRSKRLRDIGDVRLELEAARECDLTQVRAHASTVRALPLPAIVIAAVLFGLGGLYAGQWLSPAAVEQPPIYVEINPPAGSSLVSTGDLAGPVAVSPDGTMLTYSAMDENNSRSLYLRRLDEPKPRRFAGTEGAFMPFWSPDSKSIGFFTPNFMRRIDVASGATLTLCPSTGGRGGAWLDDGTIIFSPEYQSPVLRINANGGEVTPVTEIDSDLHTSHRWPYALDDSEHFIYLAITHDPTRQARSTIFLGSLDGAPPRPIMQSNFSAQVIDDQLLFVRESTLFADTLDVGSATIDGDPRPLLPGVQSDDSTWRSGFSASPAGLLAFHQIEGAAHRSSSLVMSGFSEADSVLYFARNGREIQHIAPGLPQISFGLSPDGTHLVVSVAQVAGETFDLWLYTAGNRAEVLADPTLTPGWGASRGRRLTSFPGVEVSPVFSPDNTEVAFGVIYGDGELGVYRVPLRGGRAERIFDVAPGEAQAWPTDWTRDGKYILVERGNWVGGAGQGLWAIPVDGGEPVQLQAPQGASTGFAGAAVSPNGRWLAYSGGTSGVAGNYVIEVVPFELGWPDSSPTPLNSVWRISSTSAQNPHWRADGTELFFLTLDGELMAAPVDTEGEAFSFEPPIKLADTRWEPGKDMTALPSGEQFMVHDDRIARDASITIVLNWKQLLQR